MMNTMPLRRTIRHLAQRFRIDGETFITTLLTNFHSLYSQVFDYTRSSFIRPDYTQYFMLLKIKGQSGLAVLLRSQPQNAQNAPLMIHLQKRLSTGRKELVFLLYRQVPWALRQWSYLP